MSPDEPQPQRDQPAEEPAPAAPAWPPQRDVSLEPGMPEPGPAWHRQAMRPEGAAEPPAGGPPPADASGAGDSGPSASAPGGPPPAAASGGLQPPAQPPAAVPGDAAPPAPPPPGTGGHLAAGIFLTVGGISVLSGLFGILAAEGVGFPTNAIACGIAFAGLFLVAVGVRPSPGLNPIRGTLGVVSVVFLVACFLFAVDIGSGAGIADQGFRIKLAGAGAVLAVGMLVVGVVVPSAVASGLAVLGVQAAVVASLLAAGMDSQSQLAVAAVVTASLLVIAAMRVPRLQRHRQALAWMVSVATFLAAADAIGLAVSFTGTAVAADGLLTLALALLAWRFRLVVPAIVAVPTLIVVEVFVIRQAVGDNGGSGPAVALLVFGVVILLLVGLGGAALRGRMPVPRGGRTVLPEELLLLGVVVLALISLGESQGSGLTPFPTQGGGFGAPQFSTPPEPTLPPG